MKWKSGYFLLKSCCQGVYKFKPSCQLGSFSRILHTGFQYSSDGGTSFGISSNGPKPTSEIIEFIKENTIATKNHLTPEIKLYLITPECQLWSSNGSDCPVPDPFWAFYWPGGQALTRYLLDNPTIVKGKTVLDVGAGCAASSIAACMKGAARVIANDICPVAVEAARQNAALNEVVLETESRDLIGHYDEKWDVILLGDMFYDEEFTNKVTNWIENLHKLGKDILIGDPGRVYFEKHLIKQKLVQVYSVDLHKHTMEENSGITQGFVWKWNSLGT